MEKIFTERAHLMCPHMNFGIAMTIDCNYDYDQIKEVFERIAGNHPFLRAVIGHDETDNSYFYDITDSSMVNIIISEDTLTDIDDPKLIEEYDRLTGYDWDLRKEGLLKAVVWNMQGKTAILLVFHHLLADGRGALNLAEEIADAYIGNAWQEIVNEKLISSVGDLPGNSKLSFISRMLIDKANADWEKEGNAALTYQKYHEFADSFVKNDKVRVSVIRTPAKELADMVKDCREHSVTINDLLMAKMYQDDKTDKIIIAKDLRDSLPFYKKNALGNYSTAFSVITRKPDKDIWKLAGEVHKKVLKTISDPQKLYLVLQCYARLKPEVLDASFMAAKDSFNSKSAGFIGKMFFGFDMPKGYSITNLGKIESRSINSAFFIPPASPAIRKTLGVLTVNGNMITCINERAN